MKKIVAGIVVGFLCSGTAFAEQGKVDKSKAETPQQQQEHQTQEAPQEQQAAPDGWRTYLVKELDLSNAQADKIDDIKKKYHPELSKLKKNKWKLKKELWKMSQQPEKGSEIKAQLTEKYAEARKAENTYEDKRFEMMLEARNVLDADQIASLDDVMKRKWKYHKWKHQKRYQQAQESEDKDKRDTNVKEKPSEK